jgi:translation initiation factor IF-3
VNRRIRVPEVRLVDEEGVQVGVVPTKEALAQAEEKGLDLVEVAPTARPPVCRIMDFGKFLYEQRKRQKEARKGQTGGLVKEIKISSKIEVHDINFKISHIKKFLEQKNRVKITVVFRGREVSHSERGRGLLDRIIGLLDGYATVENPPSLEGRHMTMLLAPAKKPPTGKAGAGPKAEG